MATYLTRNPATGVELQSYVTATEQEALDILASVHAAQPAWGTTPVADRAAVDGGVMGDRAKVANRRRMVIADMYHHEILKIRIATDLDAMGFGPHDNLGPDRRLGTNFHIAVDFRTRCDVDRRVDGLKSAHGISVPRDRFWVGARTR